MAAAFRLLGEQTTVLRGVAAVTGILGVAALLLALRRFGAWAAVAGTAWAAGSLWLICVGRDGFRVILVPLAGALALEALIRWGDRPERARAVIAGAAVAAGLWTYQPLKLLPLLVALWLWRIRAVDPRRFQAMWHGLWWWAAAFAVVAAPMAWAAISDPANYFGRAASVTTLNPGTAGLPLHVLRTLAMFGVTGDPNPRHNVAGLPLVGVPLCLLALTGGVRAWRRREDPAHSLILLGIPVFLIPPLVATEGGSPHFLRSLGLVPYLAALIGLGCAELVERMHWGRLPRWTGSAVAVGLAALLVVTALGSASAYFSRDLADRYHAYSFDLVALARQADHGPSTAVVVDDFAALDVRFLDATSPPTIVGPSSRLPRPERFSTIVARSPRELAGVAGRALAARATVAARDLAGAPVVWTVSP